MEDARGEFEAAHYAQAEQLADAEAELAYLSFAKVITSIQLFIQEFHANRHAKPNFGV